MCCVMDDDGWSMLASMRVNMAWAKMRCPCRCAMRCKFAKEKVESGDLRRVTIGCEAGFCSVLASVGYDVMMGK